MLGDFAGLDRDVIRLAGAHGVLGVFLDPLGHVRGELDHFAQLPAGVVDRIVAGLQPDGLTALCHAFELAAEEFALVQATPEVLVVAAAGGGRGAEDPVILALDLGRAVAHQIEEVLVGADHGAVGGELDSGHGPVDGLQLAIGFAFLLHLGGHVQGVLDDFHHAAAFIADRVVAGFQPEIAPIGCDALEGAGLELPGLQA